MAQSPLNETIPPVNIEEKGRSPTMERLLLKKLLGGLPHILCRAVHLKGKLHTY